MNPDIGVSENRRPIRVCWYSMVVPHYRVAVLNRLATMSAVDLTVCAGQDLPGVSNADASASVVAPFVRLRNRFGSRRRVSFTYSYGWTQIPRMRFDVVIMGEQTRNVVHWLLLAARRIFSYRVVVVSHVRTASDLGRLGSWLRRKLIMAADGVIAYGDEGAERAISWGVTPGKVVAMGNTIDVERVTRARANLQVEDVDRLKSELGLTGHVFLFIARPTPWKRLDVAIDAVRQLAERKVDAHILIVGTGADLQQYVAQARDMPFVHFIGGESDEEKLAVYFAASDLVLIPGAVGLAASHAFAYGLPLVTAATAEHGPEMVLARDGENSLLLEACRADVFASALESLVHSPKHLAALKNGAEETVVPTTEEMANNIAHLLSRIVESENGWLAR